MVFKISPLSSKESAGVGKIIKLFKSEIFKWDIAAKPPSSGNFEQL